MQGFRNSPLIGAAIGCLFLTVLSGCQCTRMTDCYSYVIDDVSDHQGCMDDCYSACFDLTRIGYSDWRACKCNRIWCRKCVEKDDCHCDGYHSGAYGPIYPFPPVVGERDAEMVPPVPAPEPAEELPAETVY